MALPGVAQPYGVSIHEGGLNFAVYAGEAEQCILLLYRDGQVQRIELDPETNRTGDVWHICLTEAAPLEYAYELVVEGKTIGPLLDPYAPALASQAQWGERKEPRGVVLQEEPFDWEGDQPLCLPWEQLVIYEMHVRGYTNALNSPATHRGTFLGVIEAIDHLKRLGVTAVELLPIFEFDETDNPRSDPTTGSIGAIPRSALWPP
jgi:isoamylase